MYIPNVYVYVNALNTFIYFQDKSATKKETTKQNAADKNNKDNADKPADNQRPSNENNNTTSSEKRTEESQQGQEENGSKEERPKINITKVIWNVFYKDFFIRNFFHSAFSGTVTPIFSGVSPWFQMSFDRNE